MTGVVLSAAVGMLKEILSACKRARANSKKFDKLLTNLQDTIELVTPKIEEIDKLNQKCGNFSKDEILEFRTLLEKGNDLVHTCSKIPRWNKIKRRRYLDSLGELDSSLRRLINIEIQVEQLLAIKQLLSELAEINKRLDRLMLQKMSDSVNENSIVKKKTTHYNGVATEE